MKYFIAITLSLVLLVGLLSCKKDRFTANGNVVAETREVGQFSGISSTGSTSVKVIYGTTFKVVVKGSSNLVPQFATRVVNDILYLSFEDINVRNDDIEVVLTMPTIAKIVVSGDSEIDLKGNFPELPTLDISLSGSAEVEAENLMQIAQVNVEISGAAEVDFEDVLVKRAETNISGSGEVKFQVQDNLKAKISGSGKVYYKGNPTIQQDISGSGKLIKF